MTQERFAQNASLKHKSEGALTPVVLAPDQILEGTRGTAKGKYIVEKYLGEGWTAVVYLGADAENPDHKVALKVLRPGSSEITVSSFRSEVQIISSLRNQGITCVPEIYGLFKGNPYEFIAMEFVSDQEYPRLDHILDLKGPLSEEDALTVALQALTLLDRLHNQIDRTYTDMQLKNFCWNSAEKRLLVIDWNHVSFERKVIEDGLKNNTPSVMEQLRNRGNAKDFADLARLDVLRFSAFFYAFLTGKRARESGETVWNIKTRAGAQWELLSEPVQSIVIKALVEYPGGERYKTASEMLEAVEAVCALIQNTDLDGLRDQLGEVLDRIDDGDEATSKDTNPVEWIGERQMLIADAGSLLSQIRILAGSTDADTNLSKWIDRQAERIQVLIGGISPDWGTGQRYFELGQYRTALSRWKPEAERQGLPKLWRLVLLTQAAIEIDSFSSIRNYLYVDGKQASSDRGSLNFLDDGDIDTALTRFKSAVAGLREVTGSLAAIYTELSCLQLIKQANADSSHSIENLATAAHLLNENPFPYQNIALRDPLWYSLVGEWLSPQQKETFATTGELDLVELIAVHLRGLEEHVHVSSARDSAMLETGAFVMDVLFRRRPMHDLQERLWANPADETLPITLLALLEKQLPGIRHAIDATLERVSLNPTGAPGDQSLIQMLDDLDATGFFIPVSPKFQNSGNTHQLETALRSNHEMLGGLRPVLHQMLGMTLQWGANREDLEQRIRSHYFSLTASMYVDHLNKAVREKNWVSAEQSARNLVWLKGSQTAEMEITSKLAEDFEAEYKRAQNALKKKRSVHALKSDEQLRQLGNILDIVSVPTSDEREVQIQQISDDLSGLTEKQRLELDEVTDQLDRMSILSDLMAGFIDEHRQGVGVAGDPMLIDYQSLGEKADQHLQSIEDNHKDRAESPEFKDWIEKVQRYKELSEDFMQEKTQLAEFERSYRECVEAIAKMNLQQANEKLAATNVSYNALSPKTKEDLTAPLDKLKAGVKSINYFQEQFKIAKDSLDVFLNHISGNYGISGNLDRTKLEEAKSICDELMKLQQEYADGFVQFFPSFRYEGLNELNHQVRRWGQLLPFAEILEKEDDQIVFVDREPRKEPVPVVVLERERKPLPWRKLVFGALTGILLLGLVIAGIIWVPRLVAKFTQRPTETVAEAPTEAPTEEPSEVPTEEPTEVPEDAPTEASTEVPTYVPTEEPAEVSPAILTAWVDPKVARWDVLCPHPGTTPDQADQDFDLPPLKLPEPPEGWAYEVQNKNTQLFVVKGTDEYELKVFANGQPAFGWFAPGDKVTSQIAQPCYTTDTSIAWVPPQYSYDRQGECPDGCKALEPGEYVVEVQIDTVPLTNDFEKVVIANPDEIKITLSQTPDIRIAPLGYLYYKCNQENSKNGCADFRKYWIPESADDLRGLFNCSLFTASRQFGARLWQWFKPNVTSPQGYCPQYPDISKEQPPVTIPLQVTPGP